VVRSKTSSLRPSIPLDARGLFPDQVHALGAESCVVSAGQIAFTVIEMVVAGARSARTRAMRQLTAVADIFQPLHRGKDFRKELLHDGT
jgi:hypothetical protein